MPYACSHSSGIAIDHDLAVDQIGYGEMQVTGGRLGGQYLRPRSRHRIAPSGSRSRITFLDTADVYGAYSNDLLIHKADRPWPHHLAKE